jgi:kynurenine formamidase
VSRLIDLTTTLDPSNRDKLPENSGMLGFVIAPRIWYAHPAEPFGRDQFCAALGCSPEDLPDGEGWGAEVLSELSSHCGTHVDAPLHSGSTSGGKPARTITDIALDELYRPGLVLDVRPWAKSGEEITVEMLDEARDAAGRSIHPGDAVLIRTGQERYSLEDPEYFLQPGMTRASTLHLIDQGAVVLGTDALGWDLPFGVMNQRFRETGDRSVLWDGHKAIVEREAFIVQQLTNLAALPLSGFMVGFFPIKLAACSAAPARVVAFVD